jgi:hypothetical protein
MFGSLQFNFGYRILDKISIRFADDKFEVPRSLRREKGLDASPSNVEGRNRASPARRRVNDEPTRQNGKVERRFAARYYFEQSSTISCGLTGNETSS